MAPIEFRQFLPLFQLADLNLGASPIRLDGKMYAPPRLQFRYRERVIGDNGAAPVMQWSEWQDVPFVREGADPFNVGDVPVDAQTVRQ
jgi:hypothetical protein